MVFCPIWAGSGLHDLIVCNLEKLADSLDGCVGEYFKDDKTKLGNKEDPSKRMQGYKCVLNSKATEEVMANLARWELAHGRFHFRHPWKQYLKIGTSMCKCAYCIEVLNSCINSKIQVPDYLKKHLSGVCMVLSTNSSEVLKELANLARWELAHDRFNFRHPWKQYLKIGTSMRWANNIEAELWTVRDGLILCFQLQVQAVEIELDTKSVIHLLSNNEVSLANYAPIIDDCRNLLNLLPLWKIQHCYKEANACANALARKAVSLHQEFCILDSPPVELSYLLMHNLSGLFCIRLCNTSAPVANS
nr:aluminum-activated malate transporter 10 [Quercus suber]